MEIRDSVMSKESQFFELQENPLNEVKRRSELDGSKMLLLELISSANRVGATVITVDALKSRLETLAQSYIQPTPTKQEEKE